MKNRLTRRQMAVAYIMNRHKGIEQQDIAEMYDVHTGRVNEAILIIEYTVNHPKEIYELSRGRAQIVMTDNN